MSQMPCIPSHPFASKIFMQIRLLFLFIIWNVDYACIFCSQVLLLETIIIKSNKKSQQIIFYMIVFLFHISTHEKAFKCAIVADDKWRMEITRINAVISNLPLPMGVVRHFLFYSRNAKLEIKKIDIKSDRRKNC